VEDTQSRIAFETLPEGECAVALGIWTAAHLAVPEHWAALQSALAQAATRGPAIGWDLRRLQRLDHSGAQVLWNAWGRHWPQRLELLDVQRAMLERIARFSVPPPRPERSSPLDAMETLGDWVFSMGGMWPVSCACWGNWSSTCSNWYAIRSKGRGAMSPGTCTTLALRRCPSLRWWAF